MKINQSAGRKEESYETVCYGEASGMEGPAEPETASFKGSPAGGEDLAHEGIRTALFQEDCLDFLL